MKLFHTEYERLYSEARQVLESTNDVGAARAMISAIADRDYRDVTSGKIAVLLVSRNQPVDAMALIEAIEQPMERADALLNVAHEHAQRGDAAMARSSLMRAISAAKEMAKSTWEIPSIMLQTSAALADLGFHSDATSTLDSTIKLAQKGGDFESAKVLSGAAVLLAKWGRGDEARVLTDLISQEELRKATMERVERIFR